MRQVEGTHILKGLFVPIKKADFMALSVFGFTAEALSAEQEGHKFIKDCLRIPQSLLKNDVSVIQTMLQGQKNRDQSKGHLPLTCYIKTTNPSLKAKITHKRQTKPRLPQSTQL
jgi:hypothetical protein